MSGAQAKKMALSHRISNCLFGKTNKAESSLNHMLPCDVSDYNTASTHKTTNKRPTSSTGFSSSLKTSVTVVLSNAGTKTRKTIRRRMKPAPQRHSIRSTTQSLRSSRKGVKVQLSSPVTDSRLLTSCSLQATLMLHITTPTPDLSKQWPRKKLPRLQSSVNMLKEWGQRWLTIWPLDPQITSFD